MPHLGVPIPGDLSAPFNANILLAAEWALSTDSNTIATLPATGPDVYGFLFLISFFESCFLNGIRLTRQIPLVGWSTGDEGPAYSIRSPLWIEAPAGVSEHPLRDPAAG